MVDLQVSKSSKLPTIFYIFCSYYPDVDDAADADVDQAEQVVPVILLVTQESWLVTLAYTPGALD